MLDKLIIDEVKVSIDHVKVTSNDRRYIKYDKDILGPDYRVKSIPVKGGGEDETTCGYLFYYRYEHVITGNIVKVFVERGGNNFLPNIMVHFNSSWEHNLPYPTVIGDLNRLINQYNVSFNLAGFHVATDLFCDENYVDQLSGLTKSQDMYAPNEDPMCPGTYNFHAYGSDFRLVLYDKGQQLLKEKFDMLSGKTIEYLWNNWVARYETRFNNTRLKIVPSLEHLAKMNFSWLMPDYLQFLQPKEYKLNKKGLSPTDYHGLKLRGFKQYLADNGIRNNFFSFTEDQSFLTNIVNEAFTTYRWCKEPEKYPLEQEKLRIRDKGIRFKKGKWGK